MKAISLSFRGQSTTVVLLLREKAQPSKGTYLFIRICVSNGCADDMQSATFTHSVSRVV